MLLCGDEGVDDLGGYAWELVSDWVRLGWGRWEGDGLPVPPAIAILTMVVVYLGECSWRRGKRNGVTAMKCSDNYIVACCILILIVPHHRGFDRTSLAEGAIANAIIRSMQRSDGIIIRRKDHVRMSVRRILLIGAPA